MKKRVLSIVGTRPEVIKLAPVIHALQDSVYFESLVCTTSQHRQMQDQMMSLFDLKATYDLNIMRSGQDLFAITQAVLARIKPIIEEANPDVILVQGDTTTSFAAALAGFYQHIYIGHIEAGLRTNNLLSPFPEEANRQLTARLADFHFAPTDSAKQNLLNEGIDEKKIKVTGNTVIDALFWVREKINKDVVCSTLPKEINYLCQSATPYVLITGHRRESFGDGFIHICQAIKTLAEKYPEYHFVYPVHLNPNVQEPVYKRLKEKTNIHLIAPVDYEPFIYLMDNCQFILTDSGGVQEEAPALGKPVLVMREVTERTEGITAGTAKLVGTSSEKIVHEASLLIDDSNAYHLMAKAVNPYGDGYAAKKVVEAIIDEVIEKTAYVN